MKFIKDIINKGGDGAQGAEETRPRARAERNPSVTEQKDGVDMGYMSALEFDPPERLRPRRERLATEATKIQDTPVTEEGAMILRLSEAQRLNTRGSEDDGADGDRVTPRRTSRVKSRVVKSVDPRLAELSQATQKTPEPKPRAKKIWDLDGDDAPSAAEETSTPTVAVDDGFVSASDADAMDYDDTYQPPVDDLGDGAQVEEEMPAPAPAPKKAGPAGRRGARVKTRVLGFAHSDGTSDVFADIPVAPLRTESKFPVGWILVVEGPGRGACFTLFAGVAQIGRGEDQAIKLDFGDNSISRSNHAAIAYDNEQRQFFLGHGGKSNIVRLNGNPVLSTETIEDGDIVRIGETTLRFVALCGPDFTWEGDEEDSEGAA
ncbi:MAG: FHA domain-containing protein [Pseudomonadota bacterium]